MRVDAHIHFTPPALRERLPTFVEAEPYWGALLNSAVQAWADGERTLADMNHAGIDLAVVQGLYLRGHAACVAANDELITLVRRHPGRLAAFASLQPLAGRAALDELDRCVEHGLLGVGELNPYAQGFALDEPDFLHVAEACIRRDLPICLHINEPVGRAYPGKGTTPLAAYHALARRYPELRLILAHWGGGLIFYELIPSVRDDLRNVWYDTAASPLVYPTEAIFPAALACVGPRKILYGSDYPLRIVPREQREPDFRPFLHQIDALPLDDTARADIMGGNALRVLRPSLSVERSVVAGERSALPAERLVVGIQAESSVALTAHAHPATRAVFDRYGIPWRDQPVPVWEPIGQALAAHGYAPAIAAHILAELNEAVQGS
jgi:hypothetical protein